MFRKILPFIQNLILLILLIGLSIGGCVWFVDYHDRLNSEGAFATWKSLSEPPDKLEKILSANYTTIWIQTEDESIFYLNISCWLQDRDCKENEWIQTDTLPHAPDLEGGQIISRQNNCTFQDEFEFTYFRRPEGNIVECLKTISRYPEVFVVTYYARSDENTIQYWHNYSSSNTYLIQKNEGIAIGLSGGVIIFVLIKVIPRWRKRVENIA